MSDTRSHFLEAAFSEVRPCFEVKVVDFIKSQHTLLLVSVTKWESYMMNAWYIFDGLSLEKHLGDSVAN